jgi:hypothetical protein
MYSAIVLFMVGLLAALLQLPFLGVSPSLIATICIASALWTRAAIRRRDRHGGGPGLDEGPIMKYAPPSSTSD